MSKGNKIALGLFILATIAYPLIADNAYTISIGVFAGINAIVTLGLCILMGYAGQASLGQAGFYGIGAYVSAILSLHYSLPVSVSILIAMAVSATASVILAIPALKLKGHYLAVATLGFGEIIYIMLNEWGPGGPSGFGDIPQLNFAGLTLTKPIEYFYFIWFVAILIFVFSFNLINSRNGRALRALHDSENASSAMGIDVSALKIKVFVLGAIYAGFAGALYAHYVTFVSPSSFTLFHSVIFVMMAVVGGIANLWGAILGSIAITTLPEALRHFQEFDVLVYGLILTLSLMFLRKGLVPIFIEFYDKITKMAKKG